MAEKDMLQDNLHNEEERAALAARAFDPFNPYNRFAEMLNDQSERMQIPCMLKTAIAEPSILWRVGVPGALSPDSSFSNRAYSFSEAGDILPGKEKDMGSARGAFRHALWQSNIASAFSLDLAEKIGNCHERNAPFDKNRYDYPDLNSADMAVDQQNNIIGREIARQNPHLSTKELALKVLDKAYDDGLYQAVAKTSGGYTVEKVKIDITTYTAMYAEIMSRDENGKKKE